MIWKDKQLNTINDLMEFGIDKCDSPEEAREFMSLLKNETPHAEENIGYLAGYYSKEKKEKIFEWFGVVHPIFGKSNPTFEEALKAGMDCAKNGYQSVKKY